MPQDTVEVLLLYGIFVQTAELTKFPAIRGVRAAFACTQNERRI